MNVIKLLFCGVLAFSGPSIAHSQDSDRAVSVPDQAFHAGFTHLVFADEFLRLNYTTDLDAKTGFKWYPNPQFNSATASDVSLDPGMTYAVNGQITQTRPQNPTPEQTAHGLITIRGGNNLSTVPYAPFPSADLGGFPAIKGSWQHGYFEARIQVSPQRAPSSWSAFWSYGTSTFAGTPVSQWTQSETAENDFMEWYPGDVDQNGKHYQYYGINTLHEWHHCLNASACRQTAQTGNAAYMQTLQGTTRDQQKLISDGNFHIYGCLWVKLTPTTGYVQYYLDNFLIQHQDISKNPRATGITRYLTGVGTGTPTSKVETVQGVVQYTPAGAGITALEKEHMFLIIGGQNGQPIHVDWVRVWQ